MRRRRRGPDHVGDRPRSCSSRCSCSGSSVAWFFWQINGARASRRDRCRFISIRGWGVPAHRDGAHKQHIVGSSLAFNVYARLNGDNSFQAGTYDLHTNLGVKDAVRRAQGRATHQLRDPLAIPPGLWLQRDRGAGRQAARTATGRPSWPARATTRCGRPSNRPARHESRRACCGPTPTRSPRRRTRSRSCRRWSPRSTSTRERIGLSTASVDGHAAYDIIKVASLIESEAKVPKDRPLIASVIYNRLAAQHAAPDRLDRDLRAGQPERPPALGRRTCDINSPYNTYLHTGLPPTPIGSVSDASLRAAMHSGADRLPVLRARRQRRPSRVLDARTQDSNRTSRRPRQLGLL